MISPTTWDKGDGENNWNECKDCGARQDEGQHDSTWEHDRAEHWEVCSICKKETSKVSHRFFEDDFASTEDKLGGKTLRVSLQDPLGVLKENR